MGKKKPSRVKQKQRYEQNRVKLKLQAKPKSAEVPIRNNQPEQEEIFRIVSTGVYPFVLILEKTRVLLKMSEKAIAATKENLGLVKNKKRKGFRGVLFRWALGMMEKRVMAPIVYRLDEINSIKCEDGVLIFDYKDNIKKRSLSFESPGVEDVPVLSSFKEEDALNFVEKFRKTKADYGD